MARILATSLAMGSSAAFASGTTDIDKLAGQPVDIASSAYQYRADRKADDNPPESWLVLMHYAGLPLNKPVDVNAPAIKRVLCGLLWEEIRPVHQLELTWPSDAKRRPSPDDVEITILNAQGGSSSWWNNLGAVKQVVRPTVSSDGNTYVYTLDADTCGIVVSAPGGVSAYDVPTVHVLVADTWKKMDVEIEWGFDQATAGKDYSGRVETYDGRLALLHPLSSDNRTTVNATDSWRSAGKSSARRGIAASLLYMGTSKWRRQQSFTSQPDDVARTIVTLWTKAGNFSFLAADLENGPILAPEYGFFVRRTSKLAPPSKQALGPHVAETLLANKMASIAGTPALLGWGSDDTPWFGGNPADKPVVVQGITLPANSVAMHPGARNDVAVGWRSPISGTVRVTAQLSHAQTCGNGIDWWISRENGENQDILAHGATTGTGSRTVPEGAEEHRTLDSVAVKRGDGISLFIGPRGNHFCDSTIVNLAITEAGGDGRTWDLTRDVGSSLHEGNPHADTLGNPGVWSFYSRRSTTDAAMQPSDPPIAQASQATSARAYLEELKARNISTIRQQTRAHDEQTWEGAVTAMCGTNLPPHPAPPAGSEPAMQVQVPSERLTAQWKLGAWHLVRHAGKNPKTSRLWFDDYPYGILAAETYMVLRVLDHMGSHQAAADGFDQWLSLPMDHNSAGHNEGSLPDRPTGLFSDGHGCLTLAEGPDGVGGQMDGIHAFGPGSIGWALTEHYWMTGDTDWLKASAPRIVANAEWMLRQRRLMSSVMPGGEHLWCRGLQPALQVTPDSGGLWLQFYECEAYYWASISRLATTLAVIDPKEGARLSAEAESYRKDLRAAVERSIALSPVVPVRDGTFHSVIPAAPYIRGLCTGAWGWERDGSGAHVGPLYWDTVQSAAALISPAGLLATGDVRVQGYLDVLEDRLLLENAYVGQRAKGDWFMAGWQYQGGLERTPNMHLAGDDIPVFLRSFFNCYAVDILPNDGYIFNEHAVHGPPDKIFEEAAFLERFRNMLVMEDGQHLWLARATPRAWLEQGKTISVKNAPTYLGDVEYEIVSDVDGGRITASVKMPSRGAGNEVWLRLRHPRGAKMKGVTVNGKAWKDFDAAIEVVRLHGMNDTVAVEARY